MKLTDEDLLFERAHPLGGLQRIYRFPSGYGLSVVNTPMAHWYPFAWEAAVLKGVTEKGDWELLDYSTPLTDDVVVFQTDEQANEFIARAKEYFEKGEQSNDESGND